MVSWDSRPGAQRVSMANYLQVQFKSKPVQYLPPPKIRQEEAEVSFWPAHVYPQFHRTVFIPVRHG